MAFDVEHVETMGEKDFNPSMFQVDKNNLDTEWEQQSVNTFAVGREMAQAVLAYDECKRKLELTKARISRDVRNDPDKYGVMKVTEGSVESAVTQHPDVLDLQVRVAQARYKLDISKVAATALENKKEALECLTKLAQIGYFSSK